MLRAMLLYQRQKTAPVWVAIRGTLAKPDIVLMLVSMRVGCDPELDRECATVAQGKESLRARGTWSPNDCHC